MVHHHLTPHRPKPIHCSSMVNRNAMEKLLFWLLMELNRLFCAFQSCKSTPTFAYTSILLAWTDRYGPAPKNSDSAVNILLDIVQDQSGKQYKMDHYATRYPTNVVDIAEFLVRLSGKLFSEIGFKNKTHLTNCSIEGTIASYYTLLCRWAIHQMCVTSSLSNCIWTHHL